MWKLGDYFLIPIYNIGYASNSRGLDFLQIDFNALDWGAWKVHFYELMKIFMVWLTKTATAELPICVILPCSTVLKNRFFKRRELLMKT